MALAFPLGVDAFFRTAPIMGGTFDLDEATDTLTLGGGEVLTSQLGTRLWRGTAEFTTLSHAEHEDVMALVRVLQRPGASFLVSNLHAERPGPGGCTLGGVQNGREVRLTGLPAGTVILRRSYLSWQYGTNPVRYAFHQLAETVTADGTGATGWGEVSPNVRPGWGVNAAVQLQVPRLKAIIVPKSLRPAKTRKSAAPGLAFDWQQTLR